MNSKPWKAAAALIATGMMAVAVPAHAQHHYAVNKHRTSDVVYDYAKVLKADPIVRYVTVRKPVQECWEETRHYTVERRPNTTGGALVGAIIGGVVGHQFGSGRGNDAATVAGTLIGAAVGSETAKKRHYERGDYSSTTYARPVRRCETNYQSYQEERIDGYDVIYRYRGQRYATRMPYDPGERLRVRVDVRPSPGY
ncbi:MAG: glycine zipper 2TM domain-containing protein [Pseudomonadota bacterium]